MFRKYEKTFRISVPQFDIKGKFCLSDKETKKLLTGQVVIQEKLDGANVGIIRTKGVPGYRLQKRGSLIGPSEHEQFNYFVNWAASNIPLRLTKIPLGYILYAELLYATHNVTYDRLPAFLVVFDVWTGKNYLFGGKFEDYLKDLGLVGAPTVYEGSAPAKNKLIEYIPKVSKFAVEAQAEGIVIKNKNGMRGKIVRPDFMKQADESDHWMHKQLTRNSVV